MLAARLSDPMILVNPMKAAYELIKDDVAIEIKNDGLYMRAMDPANVAMVSLAIKNTAFDRFDIEEEGYIGVNMERLISVLKRAKKTYIMDIEVGESMLTISYLGKSTRKFSIPLLSLESGPRPEPNLEFSVRAVVDSDVVKELIEDAKIVSDAVTLEAKDNELKVIAEGDLGKVEGILRIGEGLEEIEVTEEARAKYSIEYLKKMIKGAKVGSTATLQFKTDYPLKLTFSDLEVSLAYILAPRIDVD